MPSLSSLTPVPIGNNVNPWRFQSLIVQFTIFIGRQNPVTDGLSRNAIILVQLGLDIQDLTVR